MISIQNPVWFPESLLPPPEAKNPNNSSINGPVPCRQPWQRAGVLADGTLWPCCSWHGEELLGGLKAADGVALAWNGEAFRALRLRLEGKNPPAACSLCALAESAASTAA
jgi:hypothetical protein